MESLDFLPFPVHPSQRKVLLQYRAKAVAKEAELVARREQRLVELKLEVARRIEAKIHEQKNPRDPKQTLATSPPGRRLDGTRQTTANSPPGRHVDGTRQGHTFQSEEARIVPGLQKIERSPVRVVDTTHSRQWVSDTGNMEMTPVRVTKPSHGPSYRSSPALAAGTSPLRIAETPPVHQRVNRVGRSPASILHALVKGFLTRKLFMSNKVQFTVTTIKDALNVLATLTNPATKQDKELQQRMKTQLSVARMTLHQIFFQIPSAGRMAYISHSRALRQHKRNTQSKAMQNSGGPTGDRTKGRSRQSLHAPPSSAANTRQGAQVGGGKLSTATIKSMQRRQRSSNRATSNT